MFRENVMGSPLRKFADEVYYPESDGEPLGETGLHVNLIFELKAALDAWFSQRQDVLVGSNQLLYYLRGNTRRFLVPDLYVIFGTNPEPRRTLKIWEDGKAPEVVMEISSRATVANDLDQKVGLYELIGVQEYFVFDPEYRLQPEPLIALRMKGRRLTSLKVKNGAVFSRELGLELVDTGTTLRLRDPKTEKFLLTPREETAARLIEREARLKAEAEVERLRTELARLQQKQPRKKKN